MEYFEKKIDDFIKTSEKDASITICASTDYLKDNKKPAVIEKFTKIIKKFKEVREDRTLNITGIIPKLKESKNSNAGRINNDIEKLCKKEDIGFIDIWDIFHGDKSLYAFNETSLSNKGKNVLGLLLTKGTVKHFLSSH